MNLPPKLGAISLSLFSAAGWGTEGIEHNPQSYILRFKHHLIHLLVVNAWASFLTFLKLFPHLQNVNNNSTHHRGLL